MKITLPWQSQSEGSHADAQRARPKLESILTSPLARAVAATIGFFCLRLGVNASSGPVALAAVLAGALFFLFCVSGRLPFRFRP